VCAGNNKDTLEKKKRNIVTKKKQTGKERIRQLEESQAGIDPAPPPPTATTLTDVTPVGATHEYVPAVVYACWP
jgi:hypothetical protein